MRNLSLCSIIHRYNKLIIFGAFIGNVLDNFELNDHMQLKQRKELLDRLSTNLERFMDRKGVSSIDLHNELGISTGIISKMLNRNYDYNPGVLVLLTITNYLGVTLDSLFQEDVAVDGNYVGLQNCGRLMRFRG